MIASQTLIGLACLISSQGSSHETEKVIAKMSEAEKNQVQALIDSGVCLPEKIEEVIRTTQRLLEEGKLIDEASAGGQPCDGCGI